MGISGCDRHVAALLAMTERGIFDLLFLTLLRRKTQNIKRIMQDEILSGIIGKQTVETFNGNYELPSYLYEIVLGKPLDFRSIALV